MSYPVLISGYRSPVNPVSDRTTFQFSLIAGRGEAWATDIMAFPTTPPFVGGNVMTLTAGGKLMFSNAIVDHFQRTAWPRCYELIRGAFQETQKIYILADNTDPLAIEYGYYAHFYHNNPLMEQPDWMDRLRAGILGFKYRDYMLATGAAVKSNSTRFELPTQQGRIVAVQILADTADAQFSDITVNVGGTQIIINACAGLGLQDCSRPALILPCDIEPGDHVEITVDNDNPIGSSAIRTGIRFHFDGLR